MPLALPDVRQKTDADCGPTAFRTVCQFLSVSGRQPLHTALDGAGPREIENALWKAGVAVQAGMMDVEDLRHHTRRGRPVICLVRNLADTTGHWVTVTGVARGCVYYQCPTHGPGRQPAAAFAARWWDEDRGARYDRWAIACG